MYIVFLAIKFNLNLLAHKAITKLIETKNALNSKFKKRIRLLELKIIHVFCPYFHDQLKVENEFVELN